VVARSEQPYRLPEVPVSQAEYLRARVLAGLYVNGDLPTLIRFAIRAYRPEISREWECIECGARMVPERQEWPVLDVRVCNLPGYTCPQCGEGVGPPITLLATLEELLEQGLIAPEDGRLDFEALMAWADGAEGP